MLIICDTCPLSWPMLLQGLSISLSVHLANSQPRTTFLQCLCMQSGSLSSKQASDSLRPRVYYIELNPMLCSPRAAFKDGHQV